MCDVLELKCYHAQLIVVTANINA
uniref:Uncharacterized protein n=1 Tax=Arundo donax TaxID=35708 RepID=A0A0A9AB04_ARUDO